MRIVRLRGKLENSVESFHIMHAHVHLICSVDPKVLQMWNKSYMYKVCKIYKIILNTVKILCKICIVEFFESHACDSVHILTLRLLHCGRYSCHTCSDLIIWFLLVEVAAY
jgi:hypothetical protein